MTTQPTSTYYAKAFCISCLKDCNRTGGIWRQRLFICAGCRNAASPTTT